MVLFHSHWRRRSETCRLPSGLSQQHHKKSLNSHVFSKNILFVKLSPSNLQTCREHFRYINGLKNWMLKGAFRGKITGYRRIASFAYKTNIHIIINISRCFSTLNKAQTGHKRQTENSAITSHLNPRQIPRIVVKADHFSWS